MFTFLFNQYVCSRTSVRQYLLSLAIIFANLIQITVVTGWVKSPAFVDMQGNVKDIRVIIEGLLNAITWTYG
jgi:hypothetical protein